MVNEVITTFQSDGATRTTFMDGEPAPYFPFTDQSDFDMSNNVDLGVEVSSNKPWIATIYVEIVEQGAGGNKDIATLQLERSDGDFIYVPMEATVTCVDGIKRGSVYLSVVGGGVNGPDWVKITKQTASGDAIFAGWVSIQTWSNAKPIVGEGTTYPSFSHVLR